MAILTTFFLFVYLSVLLLVAFCFFFADTSGPGLMGDCSRILLVKLPTPFVRRERDARQRIRGGGVCIGRVDISLRKGLREQAEQIEDAVVLRLAQVH